MIFNFFRKIFLSRLYETTTFCGWSNPPLPPSQYSLVDINMKPGLPSLACFTHSFPSAHLPVYHWASILFSPQCSGCCWAIYIFDLHHYTKLALLVHKLTFIIILCTHIFIFLNNDFPDKFVTLHSSVNHWMRPGERGKKVKISPRNSLCWGWLVVGGLNFLSRQPRQWRC